MYTYNDIEIKGLQLKAWVDSAPPMFLAFKQAAAGDFSSPDVEDILSSAAPLQEAGTMQRLRLLSQEQRQGQVGFHLERAQGFMPAARASQTLLFEMPMSAVDEAAFYAYAPPLPENVRAGFGQTSFDLGASNMDAGSGVLSRLRNTVSYLSLIDRELIPQKIGFQHDWTAFKRTMIAEGQNSIDQVGSFFDRSRQYLTQSIYLVPS